MSDIINICRLCKGTRFLTNLYDMDGEISLYIKATTCVDLKMYPGDGFSALICKKCEKMIEKFYSFKQKCLEVDLELRTIKNSTEVEYERKDTAEIRSNEESSPQHNKENPIQNINIFDLVSGKKEETLISLQCELCGSMVRTKAELKKHLSSHGETKLFQCEFCPKRFTRTESKDIHVRSNHFGIRFVCEVCGQSSTKKQDLKRHMMIHNDARNQECHTCGRRFKRSSDLCSHIRTHSGARPYKCKLCAKDYTSHSGLRKHYETHKKTREV